MSPCRVLALGAIGLALLTSAGVADAQRPEYLGKPLAAWAGDLDNNNPAARRGAIFALGKMGSSADDLLPQLLKILRADKVGEVREAAAFSVGEIARGSLRATTQHDLVQTLTEALTNDPEPMVRRSAAVALGNLGRQAEAAQAALEKALTDPRPEIRQNVAWALGQVGGNVVPALRRALHDRDRYVLRNAANALARFKTKGHAALPELLAASQNADKEVKKAALGALVGMVTPQDQDACEPLRHALADVDVDARRSAALALGNIGGAGAKAAVPILVEALGQKTDLELRQQAAAVLKNIGPAAKAALDPLRQALTDADPGLRRNAAVALGGLEEAAEPALGELFRVLANSKEDAPVRVEAAVALAKIAAILNGKGKPAGQENIPVLVGILTDAANADKVRERTLWVVKSYPKELPKHPELFDALGRIVATPRTNTNKMLCYDAAFLLGLFRRDKIPEKGLDVLLEFLKDDSIKIYRGAVASTGPPAGPERIAEPANVVEKGQGDGRWMAVQALQRIGAERVRTRRDIVQQLRTLRNSPDLRLRDEVAALLEILSE